MHNISLIGIATTNLPMYNEYILIKIYNNKKRHNTFITQIFINQPLILCNIDPCLTLGVTCINASLLENWVQSSSQLLHAHSLPPRMEQLKDLKALIMAHLYERCP
jgi:hypothetical protein